jgi:RNA polymerase sigma-70 factor (ECF subfamily)
MLASDDFSEVLLAAQRGDEQGFARLYDEFNSALVRYFAARLPQEAEDLAADTWLQLARSLGRFEGDERGFRSFLFTIAHRRLVDHWRHLRPSDPMDPVDLAERGERFAPAMVEHAEPGSLVTEAISAREAVEWIGSVLNRDQADVVLLRLLAGLDVEEVAVILDKRPGTVRVLQHRALKKLARELSLEAVTR